MKDIRFEGTGFLVEWVSSYTSLPQFIEDFPASIFEGNENRENKISELFELVNGEQ